jgi:hypothetical protein
VIFRLICFTPVCILRPMVEKSKSQSFLSRFQTSLGGPGKERRIAWGIWGLSFLVVAAMVYRQRGDHSVALLYHAAVDYWQARSNLYTGPHGMNYIPAFVLQFQLFSALPLPWGDIAWRGLSTWMLAYGILRFVRLRFGSHADQAFLWISLMTLPLSLSGMRNGQSTVLLTAFGLHAVASMGEKRWWSAAIYCALCFVMKPLGLVLVLLAPFVYRPLIWRLPVTVGVVLAVPFLFADPAYVWAQCQDCVVNLTQCAGPTKRYFSDINGVLRIVGLTIPFGVIGKVCAAAGLPTLVAWWVLARKTNDVWRAVWLYTLTAVYLMLFNPMNEANSYVTLAPIMAFWAVEFIHHSGSTRKVGIVLVASLLSMAFLDTLMRPFVGNEPTNQFARSWYPLMTVVFLVITLVCCHRHASDYFIPSQQAGSQDLTDV